MRSCSARWRRNAASGRTATRRPPPPAAVPRDPAHVRGRRARGFTVLSRSATAVSRISTVTRAEAQVRPQRRLRAPDHRARNQRAGEGLAVTEDQDVVYREAAAAGMPLRRSRPWRPARRNAGVVASDRHRSRAAVPLFGDHLQCPPHPLRPHYARGVEGYPALVMNGGLTRMLLIETARATSAGARSPLTLPVP